MSSPEELPHPLAAAAPVLIRLRAIRPSLTPAEERVAEVVLADARRSAGLTISGLATAARTSETTVLRFCRRLGLPGYPQLRLGRLLRERQSQLRVAREPQAPAEAQHRRLRGPGRIGQPADRQAG